MGKVFSISSDTFEEPLGPSSLIKGLETSVKPPSLREILGENTTKYILQAYWMGNK